MANPLPQTAILPASMQSGQTLVSPISVGAEQAMVLSSALPPLSAKIVGKIKSGQYVPMKDLLADNMSLCSQLEELPGPHSMYAGPAKPRLREIQSPLTWVSCFLAYAAVLTSDVKTRNLLTYGRLVVREAQRHGGPGWQEYDKIFRQHAALDPSVQWNELNPSLHASTIMTYRSSNSQCCGLCHEPDHSAQNCALVGLQAAPTSPPMPRAVVGGQSRQGGPVRRTPRPETVERICISWNRGRCSFPSCSFRHICATCKRRGHKAKECEETPADSSYKTFSSSPRSSRAPGGADIQSSNT